MGGDGGVVATNRKFMRGAGQADLMGDAQRYKAESQKVNAHEAMTTCALTRTKVSKDSILVADAYGRLYHKEAAVQALLQRKSGGEDALGEQVRKLSDLYAVRFHYDDDNDNNDDNAIGKSTCPITGKVLQGGIPAILLVPGNVENPNVVSEGALQQLTNDELEQEYGPIHKRVRLAPPVTLLETIKEQVRQEQLQQQQQKEKKKKKRKHNHKDGDEEKKEGGKKQPKKTSSSNHNKSVDAAKTRVETAIQSNQVLSSLFTSSKKSQVSEKDHKDNLFAR
jgi:hypothetical protein